jgi:hypothetical protein
MNRKLLGISAIALTVAGIGLFSSLSSQASISSQGTNALPANPRILLPPIPTPCDQGAEMIHFFAFSATQGVSAPTSGSISALTGPQFTTPDGRQGMTFNVKNFVSTGEVEGLGEVSLTLDESRQAQPGTFILNSKEGTDGATQRINLFINVSIDGKQYRSANQVTLLSTAVQNFPPPPGTNYELASGVTLVDAATGKAAFSFPPGHAAKLLGPVTAN